MKTTEEQAQVLLDALTEARLRPPTKESMLALRALAQMQGQLIHGVTSTAFQGRAGAAKEAAGMVRQLHEDYHAALRLVVAEEMAAEAQGWRGKLAAKWRRLLRRMGL